MQALMCIICNMGENHEGLQAASRFLSEFAKAQEQMKAACDAMKEAGRHAVDPETRRSYDRHHKAMVRQMRAWNNLEHERERHER